MRVVKAVFIFDCADDGSTLRRTVSTPFTNVRSGRAGGGAAFVDEVKAAEGGKVDVSFNLGLRAKAILGQGDATFDQDGLPCMDLVDFKANRK